MRLAALLAKNAMSTEVLAAPPGAKEAELAGFRGGLVAGLATRQVAGPLVGAQLVGPEAVFADPAFELGGLLMRGRVVRPQLRDQADAQEVLARQRPQAALDDFLRAGVMEPRFQKVLFGLLDETQATRVKNALAPLTYAVPDQPDVPMPLAA